MSKKSLSKILEYQEIDIQLRRVLDVIEKSDDQKKMEQAKNEFSLAKKIVEESDKSASSLVDFFSNSKKYYDDVTKKIEQLESIETDNEEETLAQLAKLKERLNQLESKMSERKKRSEAVVRAYSSASERGRKIRDIHSRAKERQDALVKSKQPQIDELRGKLALLEPEIDKELLAQYRSITSERKYPAFVEVYIDGKTFSCKGCGIALSQKSSSFLTDNGFCVCESCRRYIYKSK